MDNLTKDLLVLKNSFLDFIKRVSNLQILLIAIFLSVIYIMPIIIADVYYIDDIGRTVYGGGWQHDGRFISTWFMSFLSMEEKVYSLFPFSTIFSVVLLSISGFLLAYILGIRSKGMLLIGALLLPTCPFILQVLCYKFDVLPISLSITLTIVPFLFYDKNKNFFSCSLICLFLIFGLYQTTALCYCIVLCLLLIHSIWRLNYKGTLHKLIISLISFLSAFLLYLLTISFLDLNLKDKSRFEFIFSKENSLNLFLESLDSFYVLFKTLLDSSAYLNVFILLVVFSLVRCFSFLIKNIKNKYFTLNILITILLFLCLIAFGIGINLFLTGNRWVPRSLIGYAFVCYIFLLLIDKSRFKLRLGQLVFVPLIYISFLISSQLGMFLKNKEEFSDFNINLIAPEISKYKNLKVVIEGKIRHASRNKSVRYNELPFISQIAIPYENNTFYWGIARLNKFGFCSNDYVYGKERQNVLNSKNKMSLIVNNEYLELRIKEPYVLISFKKD